MHLLVDISSHGFGHLAITAPVLNDLAKRCTLKLTVRSVLPEAKLRERIHPKFTLIPEATDFGFAMISATQIDLPASALAYQTAHTHWHERVEQEAEFLQSLKPDWVMSNVSYLPLAGAAKAGIPSVAICSLNWADLFQHFFGQKAWAPAIHTQMLSAYRSANAFLRITPGMPMFDLPNVVPVGLIAAKGQRHVLNLGSEKAVLVAMGGIDHRLPIESWPSLPGIRWLVPDAWQVEHPQALAWESLGLSFTDTLASVDAVITKPGYGTFTEAACNGTPVIYQRRDDWPEQECLIEWLRQVGQSKEVSALDLDSGNLAQVLADVWAQESPPLPLVDGVETAVKHCLSFVPAAGANLAR